MAEAKKREEIVKELLLRANDLPLSPGVYLMRDKSGKVIYVGKSRKLKQRVSQYFQKSDKGTKTEQMVSKVCSFDTILCDTEIEALSLENSLIKQYAPKYNIRLKDAKSYPYIKITNELYPRILFSRRREKDRARYFGPYSSAGTAYRVIDLLRKTLALPSCKRNFPEDFGKGRPCLYYQMGTCLGVCTGEVAPEDYKERIGYAADILRGNTVRVREELEKEMFFFAEKEEYEAAAGCRDTIRALDALREKQKVVAAPGSEQDVFGFYQGETAACLAGMFVRDGRVSDLIEFPFGAFEMTEPSDLLTFLSEHYRRSEYIPETVLLSFSPSEEDLLLFTEFLSKSAGRRIAVRVPERGEKKQLCMLAVTNAAERVRKEMAASDEDDSTLFRLANILALETLPERIESYDISNLGREHKTAGMIVVKNGRFSKADYRSFSIKEVEGTDDYASMAEALRRRISHLSDESGSFSEYPDLILLDGGKGHVSTVKTVLAECGAEIPVFGMVKDDFHKTRALCTEDEEIGIATDTRIFRFLYRIQEEVHRYSISRMHTAKRNTLKHSSLEKIPGIGEAKAKKLLKAFGSIQKLKEASREEIAAVPGLGKRDAEAVFAYFASK